MASVILYLMRWLFFFWRKSLTTKSHRCKNYRLANFFPARAIAAGCLFVVLSARGLQIPVSQERWLDDITSGKVDMEDFEEVLVELRGGPCAGEIHHFN